MRGILLANLSQGINRLNIKGTTSTKSMYDLQNCYITQQGSINPREGTTRFALLDSNTVGLMASNGLFNVFATGAGITPFNMTAGTNGAGIVGYDSGVPYGSLSPVGATLAGFTIRAFTTYTSNSFVISVTGNATGAKFDAVITDANGVPFTFSYTPQAGAFSNPAGVGGNTAIFAGGVTKFTYFFSSGTKPVLTSTVVYPVVGSVPGLPAVPGNFRVSLLINPNYPGQPLKKIWFAKPFLGFPYVVAEFTNNDVFHYWLQNSGTWAANTDYTTSDVILPTVSTGLAYIPVRGLPANPVWTSETGITLNTSRVDPTVYTGFYYKPVAVAGTTPHTGLVEPNWPTTAGATIQEFGDFDTSATDVGTTTDGKTSLSNTITDRYGDSQVISNAGTASTGVTTTVGASTVVTNWAKGALYAPGAVVKPSTNQGAFLNAVPNGDFEAGDDGSWVHDGNSVFVTTHQYQGGECVQMTAAGGNTLMTMNTYGVVAAGKSVTASAYVNPNSSGADLSMGVLLRFFDSSDTLLQQYNGPIEQNGGYRKTSVTGVAPTGATRVRVQIFAGNGGSSRQGYVDLVSWNLATPVAISNFLFEAVQTAAATSGASEPIWPTIAGNTVVDNGVTWKAVGTSIITWQAIPIMRSGTTEPVWPTAPGTAVFDPSTYKDANNVLENTGISWTTTSRRVTDSKCPNTKITALAASHVFAGDNDIVPFSAAVDPTDWSTSNNSGYLPTGLNNYGDNPVSVLTLYRSNLIAMNAGGYQMWQVDPDPSNMALLDAQPVGSIYTQAAQSVANDLLFLTEVGVRNLGTAGANANMQIGNLGQPIDVLVKAQIAAGTYYPISLYYPGKGQYWLIFGPQAFVLTINGTGLKTWSRYVFPENITDWCLSAGLLYLRTNTNKVWLFDDTALQDDVGGTPVNFYSWMQWPYINTGPLGFNAMLVGIDLVGDGMTSVQIAYREDDPTTFIDRAGFSTSLNVTAAYSVNPADTVPGTPIPIPINAPSYSLILQWNPNQAWQWQAATLYVTSDGGAGSTS